MADQDHVLLDINLPGEDGLSFTKAALKVIPNLAVLIMTGQDSMFHTIEAMKAGAYDYIAKPFDLEVVEQLVEKVAQDQRRQPSSAKRKQARSGKSDLLVGSSSSMRELYKAIGRVADTDLTVLIQGESGTGKELVARSIHQHSGRATRSFVAINCAAIPSELLESELFGHEKGAFTGAVERKRGKLEIASGGTLFLDEVGDIPMETQVKLLRVLEDGEITRVGSNKPIKVDVRLISATNREIETLIEDGKFREDLYYRLKVVTVHLPPLRERRQDIPLLLNHFIGQFSRAYKKPVREIEREAVNILSSYGWPGNVRELKHVVENMVVVSGGPVLMVENLPESIHQGQHKSPTEVQSLVGVPLKEVEKILIGQTLEQVGGNRQEAARMLGIGERTMYRKLKEYGLS